MYLRLWPHIYVCSDFCTDKSFFSETGVHKTAYLLLNIWTNQLSRAMCTVNALRQKSIINDMHSTYVVLLHNFVETIVVTNIFTSVAT